jgi:hypothetical protein
MRAFQAYSKHGRTTADTPQAAALQFFARFPGARKCSITEGESEGGFFTVAYSLRTPGNRRSWRDITKKQAAALPAA